MIDREECEKYIYELMEKAFKKNAYNFIKTMVRVGGITDANWDPFDEINRSIDDCNWAIENGKQVRGLKCAIRMSVLLYCQTIESSAPHVLLANLLRILNGKEYVINPLGHLGRRIKKDQFRWIPPSATKKFSEIQKVAEGVGESKLSKYIDLIYDDRIRNSFSHSDYIITDDYYRWTEGGPPEQISIDKLAEITDDCFIFYGRLLAVYRLWRKQLLAIPRYHKWPNYEVFEVLKDREIGVYGYQVHFSNGQVARFSRRTEGVEALNINIEKDGGINYFYGLFETPGTIRNHKIDGKQVFDWEIDQLNEEDEIRKEITKSI